MKKDIEWLKKEIGTEMIQLEPNRKERWSDVKYQALRSVAQKLNQLDEPEVLSAEWIEDNTFIVTDEDGDDYAVVGHSTLQNLLVPKKELPVIPQYVADWIKEERGTMSNWKLPSRFISDSKYKKDQRRYKWSQVEGNMDKFMSALINSYEVEEEPKYHALIKGYELVNDYDIYWNCDKSDYGVFVSRLHPPHDNFITEMSKAEWNKLGINDSNADFVKVGEELN